MPKLARLQEGTKQLQARLAEKSVATQINRNDLDRALSSQVENSSKVLGDRIEGALNRLLDKNTEATAKTLARDIGTLAKLLQQSHQVTMNGLNELAQHQVAAQARVQEVINEVERKGATRSSEMKDDLVARLEQLAIDLGTVPRTTPKFPEIPRVEVDLDPLTDLTLQVLTKVSEPSVSDKKEFTFEVERDPFTDLIKNVHVKEI